MTIFYRSGTVGVPFTFQIPTQGASVFLTEDLPLGFTCSSTGLITGTPVLTDQRSITLLISNGITCSAASLSLTVVGPSSPLISSPTSANGIVNFAFTYQILAAATPSITSYGASSLPAGLSVNTTTGLISGTPTSATASTTVVISATNPGGTTYQNVNFVILAMPLPVYSGPSSIVLNRDISNSFQVTASNPTPYQPTSYSATNLPSGMSINPSTGLISGSPATAGTITNSYNLFATNARICYVTDYRANPYGEVLSLYPIGCTSRMAYTVPVSGNAFPISGLGSGPFYCDLLGNVASVGLSNDGTRVYADYSYFLFGPGSVRNQQATQKYFMGGRFCGPSDGYQGSRSSNPYTNYFGPNSYIYNSTENTLTFFSFYFQNFSSRQNLNEPYYDQIYKLTDGSYIFASPSRGVGLNNYTLQNATKSSILKCTSNFSQDLNWTTNFLNFRSFIVGQKSNGNLVAIADPNIVFLNSTTGAIASTGISSQAAPNDFCPASDSTNYSYGFGIIGGGLQPDEKIIVASPKKIIRISSDGSTIDSTFSSNSDFTLTGASPVIKRIHVYKNGKILVCGDFQTFKGTTVSAGFIRLNSNGTLDTSFSANPFGNPQTARVQDFKVLPDGKIIIIHWDRANQWEAGLIYRLNENGTNDVQLGSINSSGAATSHGNYYVSVASQFFVLPGPEKEDVSVTATTATVTLTNAGGSTSVPIDFSVVAY
jgi:hypothetical protein